MSRRPALADAVSDLLCHVQDDPRPVLLIQTGDRLAVALLLDRGYLSAESARSVLPLWRRDVARVLRALAAEREQQ